MADVTSTYTICDDLLIGNYSLSLVPYCTQATQVAEAFRAIGKQNIVPHENIALPSLSSAV